MGNQARVADAATVVSTSTRNFPNRLGKGANVYLASAELAAVAALKGELPTPQEYLEAMETIDPTAADTYRYLNFDQLPEFTEARGLRPRRRGGGRGEGHRGLGPVQSLS